MTEIKNKIKLVTLKFLKSTKVFLKRKKIVYLLPLDVILNFIQKLIN